VVIVKWLVCQILNEVSVAVMCKLVLKWKFQKIDKKENECFSVGGINDKPHIDYD
jgi:hypothetical protein